MSTYYVSDSFIHICALHFPCKFGIITPIWELKKLRFTDKGTCQDKIDTRIWTQFCLNPSTIPLTCLFEKLNLLKQENEIKILMLNLHQDFLILTCNQGWEWDCQKRDGILQGKYCKSGNQDTMLQFAFTAPNFPCNIWQVTQPCCHGDYILKGEAGNKHLICNWYSMLEGNKCMGEIEQGYGIQSAESQHGRMKAIQLTEISLRRWMCVKVLGKYKA